MRAIETILFVLQHAVNFREHFRKYSRVLFVPGLLAEVHPPLLFRSTHGTFFGNHVDFQYELSMTQVCLPEMCRIAQLLSVPGLSSIDQTSANGKPHDCGMSRERICEATAELRGLIEQQNRLLSCATFLDMSAEDLTVCLRRHARIEQLSKELNDVSSLLFYAAEQKTTTIN